MVRLMMRATRHEADNAKTADVLHLLRVAGCHGQQDTVRQRLGLGAPAVEMRLVNLVSLSRDHALYRFDRSPRSGNGYFDAAVYRLRDGISLERDFVHVDEMLAQGFKVDLGPVGIGVSLQDADNLLDGAKGILARHRGRGGVRGLAARHHLLMHHLHLEMVPGSQTSDTTTP